MVQVQNQLTGKPVNGDQQSSVVAITRYGLPVVVGIFYLTASLGFEFTADSTFRVLNVMRNGSIPDGFPSPLWQFQVKIGEWFHLDPVLASKVLSLVFASAIILMTYLVANEVLHDRLAAFCVSLVSGMQGWLLQIAPSGSALALAIALTLAGIFFMLRNEYVVAPFILGMCTLVFWQAVVLLVPLFIDIRVNSVNKRRSVKVMFGACLVYLSALLPWGVFAWINGVDGPPVLLQVVEVPRFSSLMIAMVSVVGALGISGIVLSLRSGLSLTGAVRLHAGVFAYIVCLGFLGVTLHTDAWLALLPLLVVYAFHGLAELSRRFGRQRSLYTISFVLSGLLLIPFQYEHNRVNTLAMVQAVAQANELQVVALWLRTNSPAEQQCVQTVPGYSSITRREPSWS